LPPFMKGKRQGGGLRASRKVPRATKTRRRERKNAAGGDEVEDNRTNAAKFKE